MIPLGWLDTNNSNCLESPFRTFLILHSRRRSTYQCCQCFDFFSFLPEQPHEDITLDKGLFPAKKYWYFSYISMKHMRRVLMKSIILRCFYWDSTAFIFGRVFKKNPSFKIGMSRQVHGCHPRFTFWLTLYKVICFLYSSVDCFYIWKGWRGGPVVQEG